MSLVECQTAEDVRRINRINRERIKARRKVVHISLPPQEPVHIPVKRHISIRFVPNMGIGFCWVRAFPWGAQFFQSRLIPPHLKNRIGVIRRLVCRETGIDELDIISQRRTKWPVEARQIAMYLSKMMTTHSYPEIGRQFGGRDHTTAMHAFNTIARRRSTDPRIAALVSDLEIKVQIALGERAW